MLAFVPVIIIMSTNYEPSWDGSIITRNMKVRINKDVSYVVDFDLSEPLELIRTYDFYYSSK